MLIVDSNSWRRTCKMLLEFIFTEITKIESTTLFCCQSEREWANEIKINLMARVMFNKFMRIIFNDVENDDDRD
jgi:hypothetical protein